MTDRNFVDSGMEDGFTEEEAAFTPEPQDSLWKRGKDGKYRPVMVRKKELPYLAIALVALLGIIGGGLYLFSGDGSNGERMGALEKRLAQLESRMSHLEAGNGEDQDVRRQQAAIDKLGARFNRLESSLGKRIDQLATDVKKLKTPPPAKKAAPKASSTQKAPAEKPDVRYHTVQKKETLYRISVTYGLTVEQLLQLNDLPKDAVIKPGQKLRVSQ